MKTITLEQLKKMLVSGCEEIIAGEPRLTELDTLIGDGDHVICMKMAFTALKDYLKSADFKSPFELLRQSGICIIKMTGGTSGALFGAFFLDGSSAVAGKEELSSADLAAAFSAGIEAVMDLGGGKPGRKTMIDPMYAVVEEMNNSAQEDVVQSVLSAAITARRVAEDTKNIRSQLGRSKNFREKTMEYPDPGAISVALLFEGFSSALN